MPSYLESLSMVALEAWAMGKPVLANAKCDVLQGQCLRSNAGLFYENFAEFAETLRAIDMTPSLQAALGRNGRAFFERHYAWPVIEKKYVDMLQQLSKEAAPRHDGAGAGLVRAAAALAAAGRQRREEAAGRSISGSAHDQLSANGGRARSHRLSGSRESSRQLSAHRRPALAMRRPALSHRLPGATGAIRAPCGRRTETLQAEQPTSRRRDRRNS